MVLNQSTDLSPIQKFLHVMSGTITKKKQVTVIKLKESIIRILQNEIGETSTDKG